MISSCSAVRRDKGEAKLNGFAFWFSSLFIGLGKDVGAGFVIGLDSMQGAVTGAMNRLGFGGEIRVTLPVFIPIYSPSLRDGDELTPRLYGMVTPILADQWRVNVLASTDTYARIVEFDLYADSSSALAIYMQAAHSSAPQGDDWVYSEIKPCTFASTDDAGSGSSGDGETISRRKFSYDPMN